MNIQLLNDAVSNLSNTINNLNMSINQDKKTQNVELKKIKIINRLLELIKEYKIADNVDKEKE